MSTYVPEYEHLCPSCWISLNIKQHRHFRNCSLVWRLNKDGGLAKPSRGLVQFDHRQQHRISKDRLTDMLGSVQFDHKQQHRILKDRLTDMGSVQFYRRQHQISKDQSTRMQIYLVMTSDQLMRLQSAVLAVVCCNQSFKSTTFT